MNSDSAYTPLETLLLFQALRADGVDSVSFNRISDQLKAIPAVRNDRRYDGGRLSPDALRELYLTLLKEEVKRDLERQTNGETSLSNGDVSPGSRKRKAPSPSLPTVSEATKHSHLIPQLVTRLYAGFRKHYVETNIQPLERRYATIKEEISEIEAGSWDERLQQKQLVSQTQSPKPSSTAHTQPALTQTDQAQPSAVVPSPSVTPKPAESAVPGHVKRYSQAKIDAVINHGPDSQDSPGAHQRNNSNASLPPLAEMAPQSPRHGLPPNATGAVPPQMQQMHHGYTHSPPAHQSPYPPQNIQPRSGSVSSPQVQQAMSRASQSPRPILPPPKGMQYQPSPQMGHTGSPGMPHQQMPQHPQAHPQHFQQPPPRMHGGPSPTGEMQPRGYPGTPLAPHPSPGYYQQPPQQQQYANRRPSYPQPVQGHQTPTYPTQAPHPGGYMLPPFQIQPQEPGKPMPPQQQPLRPQQPHMASQRPVYPAHGHIAPATGPRQPPAPPVNMSGILAALATPPRSKLQGRALWKPQPFNTPANDQTPKPRPEIEPLSPTLGRAKSPVRSTRSKSHKDAPTIEEPSAVESTTKSRSSKRRANARDRSPHSVVSSVADESLLARTRSQSVSTVAGAHPPSDDRPRSRNGVKAEASTPSNMLEEPDAAASSTSSKMTTRRRRGTMQSQPQPSTKRKREDSPSESAQERDFDQTPPPRSNTVNATRNFGKMSSAVMNDITSHKHASYFAKEVRDKDAPGYSEIVKHPQNLKSIRSAITAGGKAVAAATANMDSPAATPSATSTTVELERTADLIPPKAIVNGAQFEKELMRMLANAYMFNPGEDGMALSTKEMFEDVEQKISEWRGTEREAGGDEEEEGKGKRRKV